MTHFGIYRNGELKTSPFKEGWEELAGLVGGYIEHIMIPDLADKGIDLWVNDEGKLIGLEPTIGLMRDGRLVDVLNGTVVFTRFAGAETHGLTDADVEFIREFLNGTDGCFVLYDEGVAFIPFVEL